MNAANKPLIPYGWLRALLYVLLSLFLLSALMFVLARFFPAAPEPGEDGSPVPFILNYLLLALLMIGLALVMRRRADRQSILSMGFAWKKYGSQAAAGFFLGTLILSVGSLVLVMLQYLYFTSLVFNAADLIYSALLFVVVAFVEEIAFRGYILNNLLQSMNKWAALAASAVLFSLFHAANQGVGFLALLNIFIAGLLLGVNYIFTRNLWFAIFFHFSWNFFQGPVMGYEVSGLPLNGLLQQAMKGPDLLTGGAFGFEGSLVCLLLNTLALGLLVIYYNGQGSRTIPRPLPGASQQP